MKTLWGLPVSNGLSGPTFRFAPPPQDRIPSSVHRASGLRDVTAQERHTSKIAPLPAQLHVVEA